MIYCKCFVGAEDRATLRSDPSADPNLREAVYQKRYAAFFHCLPETNALNLGVWGRAPSLQRINAGFYVFVILLRR